MENKLKAEASKKGFKGKKAAAYIYGTMNKMGAMKGNKETAKGKAMAKKHAKDTKKKFNAGAFAKARKKHFGL